MPNNYLATFFNRRCLRCGRTFDSFVVEYCDPCIELGQFETKYGIPVRPPILDGKMPRPWFGGKVREVSDVHK